MRRVRHCLRSRPKVTIALFVWTIYAMPFAPYISNPLPPSQSSCLHHNHLASLTIILPLSQSSCLSHKPSHSPLTRKAQHTKRPLIMRRPYIQPVYKDGTNEVLRWLINSANKCRPAGARWLKLRTTLQGNVKAPAASLVAWASRIATDEQRRATITQDILDTICKVIAQRSEYARWYKANGRQDLRTLQSNNRHRHFYQVLQRVFEILGAEFDKRLLPESTPELAAVERAGCSSTPKRYAILRITEPAAKQTQSLQQQHQSSTLAAQSRQQQHRSSSSTSPAQQANNSQRRARRRN